MIDKDSQISKNKKIAPLSGVNVLDMGCYLAGPLAGMLLTDQGANTIKIEPPDGPLFNHPVNSVINRGKTHLGLDLKNNTDIARLKKLIKNADILIENFSALTMNKLCLSVEELNIINPNLIIVSIKGFPMDVGNLNSIKAYEGIVAAACGQYTDIHAIRKLFGLDPLFTALPLASVYAAVHAATASVLALRNRLAGNGPAYIEASLAGASVSATSSLFLDIEKQPEKYEAPRLPKLIKNLILPTMSWLTKGSGIEKQEKVLDIARKSFPALMTSYKCLDGKLLYLFAIDNYKITYKLLHALGIYDLVIKLGLVNAKPYPGNDLRNNLAETANLSKELQGKLKTYLANALLKKESIKWEQELNQLGIPCAIQRTTEQWLELSEIQKAGLVVPIVDSELGHMLQPGLQTWLSSSPPSLTIPKSRMFNKNDKTEFSSKNDIMENKFNSKRAPKEWLKGITVVDISSMVAGPVSGRTLAEYGARVIKVEPPKPNHGPRMTCWYHIDVNQGKESVILDLKTLEGKKVFSRLLEKTDVLLTNMIPQAMDKLGLGELAIRKKHPSLIYANLNSYNGSNDSDWSNRVGYDPVLQAASGIMTRYGSSQNPELHAIASCVDALAGYSHAFGMSLALFKKTQHSEGCSVNTSLSMAANLVQIPFAFKYDGQIRDEANGQHAKGESGLYRLYETRNGWIFIAANKAKRTKILKYILNEKPDINDKSFVNLLIIKFKKIKSIQALKLLKSIGVPATVVENIPKLRRNWVMNTGHKSLRLNSWKNSELGKVIQAPAQQVTINNRNLNEFNIAEKPGESTLRVLAELDFDGSALVKMNVAAVELSPKYLPS
jgi:crotonobetainyl-CoA:carnitine CoA-transferase CaiB-like acyl-CoA transferase